jgi:hypothetical protein
MTELVEQISPSKDRNRRNIEGLFKLPHNLDSLQEYLSDYFKDVRLSLLDEYKAEKKKRLNIGIHHNLINKQLLILLYDVKCYIWIENNRRPISWLV